MGKGRIAAIALSGALAAGGTGAAIAAAGKNDEAKQGEQALLDDAAKRLDVTPERLRDALGAAQDAQVDKAVQDGKLTRRQADAIKAARKDSGRVLRPIPPGVHGRLFSPGRKHAFGMRRDLIGDVAKALGTTPARLFDALRSGKSIADVAKANGTSPAAVRSAVKTAVKARLDKAVDSGDLTRKQADAMLERVDEKLAAIASGKRLRFGRRGPHGGMAPDEVRPGGLLPGDEAPQLVPPGGIYD